MWLGPISGYNVNNGVDHSSSPAFTPFSASQHRSNCLPDGIINADRHRVTKTQFVTFISNEKRRTSLLLGARGRADVYAMVILWPELLASFQAEV